MFGFGSRESTPEPAPEAEGQTPQLDQPEGDAADAALKSAVEARDASSVTPLSEAPPRTFPEAPQPPLSEAPPRYGAEVEPAEEAITPPQSEAPPRTFPEEPQPPLSEAPPRHGES